MAEKTDKLNENPGALSRAGDSGILSETDKEIISAVASNSDDEFTEIYTDETDESAEKTDAPDEIRSQIERTRREMGETIDEIQERLSYSNISEQVSERVNEALETAKASVYKATVGKAENFMRIVGKEMKTMGREISKTQAGKTVMKNPVPFALIGLGAGILLMNAFGKNKTSRYGNGYDYDSSAEMNRPSMLKSSNGGVKEKLSNTYESLSETTSGAYESVSGLAGRAYDGVTHAAESAYGSVNTAAHQAYEKAGELKHQAREKYDHYIEENPLAVGAVALAVGAAVGFALPATRYESRVMGETRDNLMQKANHQVKGLIQRVEETAQETIEKVKTAADETTKTARDEANRQGLTS